MKKILLFSVIAISLLSCSKKNDVIPPKEENQTETKLLIDSVITDNDGYITIQKIKYDNLNRMTEMTYHNVVENGNLPAKYIYTYDVRGNLIRSEFTLEGGSTIAYEYTYKDDLPIHIKLSQQGQVHMYDITVQNNQETGYKAKTLTGEVSTAAYTYENQNLASAYYESFSSTGAKTSTISFSEEYGTHKSPYLYSGYKLLLPGAPQYAGKNELLKESILYNGDKTSNTYQYTYNKQGYPVKAQLTSISSTNSNSTITYKYINAR